MKNIKNCILACLVNHNPGDVITSEKIIARLRSFPDYLIDKNVPASRSINAMYGREIRQVGERFGLLEFLGKAIVKTQNGKTTLARYRVL